MTRLPVVGLLTDEREVNEVVFIQKVLNVGIWAKECGQKAYRLMMIDKGIEEFKERLKDDSKRQTKK